MSSQHTPYLTPSQIVEELDKYIIGQKEAKRNVAIALRNRWRRMNAKEEMRNEIVPNNILMIGPTGVGKTEIARRLAKLADAPFVKVEASKFTEVGYVGRDVESMVRDLVEQAVKMVKAKKYEEVKNKASEIVEEIILDTLIPPVKYTSNSSAQNAANFISQEDEELNEKTREKFREKIRKGELDDRKIDIDIQYNAPPGMGVIGGPIDEISMMNIQEMISGLIPKKNKKRKVTIAEAKKILLEEEASKLIDMDEVKELAIEKAQNSGIIFIDEIDKIASTGNKSGGPDVSRQGVQKDLLPIVEGCSVNTKYGVVHTDHVLFIAAGAFHLAKPSDLIPELQGRFPIRVELNSLTKEDFAHILVQPKNALTKQYIALMEAEGVSLEFDNEAIEKIADMAFQLNTELENIGARRLHTVMSYLLNDFLFDIPDKIPSGSRILITKEMVESKLSGLLKNRDLSKYII
ncbi:MAG: ATP-dependent protease ATPase subunit HslU [Cytophagaceae bacterium]|nr:ATP-dependent protease ATPase subunit HslU [Cytophagaceae bacterium]MDW8456689.1 ATP-dependent protease ATPase subunit HslU [Cytophagaceae bacterium]